MPIPPSMFPMRHRSKLSLYGTVPGIEYNRHIGGAHHIRDTSALGQTGADAPYMTGHSHEYNPRPEFISPSYAPYEAGMPHLHTPPFGMPIEHEEIEEYEPPTYKSMLEFARIMEELGLGYDPTHRESAFDEEMQSDAADPGLSGQKLELQQAWSAPWAEAQHDAAGYFAEPQPNEGEMEGPMGFEGAGIESIANDSPAGFAHDVSMLEATVEQGFESPFGPMANDLADDPFAGPSDQQFGPGLDDIVTNELPLPEDPMQDDPFQQPFGPMMPDPWMPGPGI